MLLCLVKNDTLMNMVDKMSEKIGLVHQMPFACDRDGFAATFEKVYLYLLATWCRTNYFVDILWNRPIKNISIC